MQILGEKYEKLILEEKALLQSLLTEIRTLSHRELEEKLKTVIDNLENLFSVVLIGEFSTGKSTIINTLLGDDVLPRGITPTTDKITVIKYGEKREKVTENGNLHISVPEERLKGFTIVDTPGTNVTLEQHQQITEQFIPNADIVFFIIGAERAVTGSEAKLIKFVKEDWLKNIVFVLNKIDLGETEEEVRDLIEHSESELRRLFDIEPSILPISAKEARLAKENSDAELLEKSGFKKLEEYIFETLGEEERIRMKIESSSEIAISLSEQTEEAVERSLDKIESDREKLDEFETRLEGMKEEIVENSAQFVERIRSRLLEFKTRGIEFIDDLIRFENIFKLLSKEKVAKEFESRVSKQTVKELEKDLDAMVRWTERSAKNLMDGAIDFYQKSIQPESRDMKTGFSYDRTQLINTVRSELEMKRKEIDPERLGGNLVDSARGAIASVLGVQVGSIAIGAAVVSAFSSLIVDVTGILTTIAVVATAFAILPRKRRKAMREFSEKVDNLIEEMISSISSQLERDMNNIKMQIVNSLMPLRNFYKTEKKKLEQSKEKVEEIREEFEGIRGRIV